MDNQLFKTIHKIQIETSHLAEGILAGAYRSAFKGKGIEFEEVRPYTDGDEVRSIDWNVTAKTGAPYVKTFREERELTVMLIVDASSSTRFGSTNQTKNQLIAEVGALIAFSAIQNNDQVGLLIFSDEIELFLAPKKGTRHVLRIVRELLVSPEAGKKTNLVKAMDYFGNVQERRCICFIISDFLCDGYENAFALLAKKHDLIAISTTDPYEASFPNINLAELTDLETGDRLMVDTGAFSRQKRFAEAAKRRLQHVRDLMGKIRGGFIDLRTDRPYVHALEQFFKNRSRHFHDFR